MELVHQFPHSCEAYVQAKGTCFYLIAGSCKNGNYLCVPSHNTGCDLSRFTDTFWNKEKISHFLNPVDTESLVSTIRYLLQPGRADPDYYVRMPWP